MRSRLLKRPFLEDLMRSPDLDAVIRKLMETEYAADLEERLLQGRTANQVDLALRDNMVRSYRKVYDLANDEGREILVALLGRWDLFNVKTVVRGKHHSLSPEEILDSVMPVGQMSRVDLEELARQESVKAVADTLATWRLPFAEPLNSVMPEYADTHNLALLELALDRYYTEWAAKRLKGRGVNKELVKRFIGAQVDTINLVTAIRLLYADLGEQDPMSFFLPGGMVVDEALFKDLVSKSDVDEIYERLKHTPYGRAVEAVAIKYVETGSVSVFERALEDYLTKQAFTMGRGDPLGAGVMVSYLWMKANEVTNLRIIVKGVSVGMPVGRMEEELIVV
jgi:V/A-type H+-transporting ATPase subunit C